MQEIFKDIKGYEGLYQVSNLGNVKSLPKGDGNGNKERILKFDNSNKTNTTTYLRVTLSGNGKTKRFSVHRLVAEAFIPNPDNKPHVNHIDNNGENNTVANLEWCTHSENMVHAQKQGRLPNTNMKAAKNKIIDATIDKYTNYLNTSMNGRTLINFFKKEIGKRQRWYGKFTCDNCNTELEADLNSVTKNLNRKEKMFCRVCSINIAKTKDEDIV